MGARRPSRRVAASPAAQPGLLDLVALGYRTLPPTIIAALEAAERHGELIDLPLTPLAPEEAETLTGDPELYRLSGGNPFYLLALAANRSTKAIAAAIGPGLETLSEPARRLAFGAAVVGNQAELDLAAAAAELSGTAALEALDEVVATGLSPRGGATPLPLPPPDRQARRLRHGRRGLAARRARARRGRAHRRSGQGAPPRALRQARR